MTETWRDVADQLTADQVARVEENEADGLDADSLIFMARDLVAVRLDALFQL
jgi:hypothetical protein